MRRLFRRRSPEHTTDGFTLIELLVVIAIIAILAAMLMPALRRARAKAKESLCLSRLKQLMIGAHLHAEDHDGEFPSRAPSKAGYPHQMIRGSAFNLHTSYIEPYVDETTTMLSCPFKSMTAPPYVQWSSYSYFVWPHCNYWQVNPEPELVKRAQVGSSAPLWACTMTTKNGSRGLPHTDTGDFDLMTMNAGLADGSARGYKYAEVEVVWFWGGNGHTHYWPTYREP